MSAAVEAVLRLVGSFDTWQHTLFVLYLSSLSQYGKQVIPLSLLLLLAVAVALPATSLTMISGLGDMQQLQPPPIKATATTRMPHLAVLVDSVVATRAVATVVVC